MFHTSPEYRNTRETPVVSLNTVDSILKSVKQNKSPGADNISYEHFIFGGDLLRKVLAKLLTAMFKYAYIPLSMKKGIIVTLFKGGKKDKKDPNSYRAITFTSCVLKLFEKVILLQLQNTPSLQHHTLQGGFQKGLGCLMSSFILHECIYFTMENKSKLFTVF